MGKFSITSGEITLNDIHKIISNDLHLELSDGSIEKINASRSFLDEKLANSEESFYGINTGFGALYNKRIGNDDLQKLQENLVMSHACGVGDKVADEVVQLMMLLKILSLSKGYSSVQLETVQQLVNFYNLKIYPVVYKWGSLGASGDLAPLAHMSLSLIGMGEVNYKGNIEDSKSVLSENNLSPIKLKAKEGLALINGTQFVSALAVHILLQAKHLLPTVNFISALSLDAFDCCLNPFHESLQSIRPHKGQSEVAALVRKWLSGSKIAQSEKKHLQDPYSFRCIPQVHGATINTINHVEELVNTEINSVTDNPTVFAEDDRIISGGNFHAQPLAMALDYLCIALAELGSISERRTYKLISGERDLPLFLINNPGINSGLMIPQYTAAALVSRNKLLCTSASADSIVSSNGQEDHVSMGAHAAIKGLEIMKNVYQIISIELLTASQALHYRDATRTSEAINEKLKRYRENVSVIDADRPLYKDISKTSEFILKSDFTL